MRCQGSEVTYLHTLRQAAGHVRGQLVADDRTLLEGQQDGGQALGATAQQGRVPTPALGTGPAHPVSWLLKPQPQPKATILRACWEDSHTLETHTEGLNQ